MDTACRLEDLPSVIANMGGESVKGFCAVSTHDPIYPTPLLGQDMTQGQFLSGV